MWSTRPQGLGEQEREAAWKLHWAFEVARNRHAISPWHRGVMSRSRSSDLNAGNPYARIKWGDVLWSEFVSHFDLCEENPLPEIPLFWLTLVDIGCFTAHDAEQINLAAIIHKLRGGLGGLSYIGMIDAAYYTNIAPGTEFSERRGVNWHLHLFAWGETRKQIKARFATLNDSNDNYRPIIPEGLGADWKQVTEEMLPIRFRYMLKTPRKSYRIGRKELCDPEGRVDFKFMQNKSDLRPGERVTLFLLLKRFWLNELTVAGGEGVELRRRALRQITTP